MRTWATRSLVAAAFLLTTPGCFQRWGTPLDGPLPANSPANDLIVVVENPVTRQVCDRSGVFGRVSVDGKPWPDVHRSNPHPYGSTPRPPDAWIEVLAHDEPADVTVSASRVYFALMVVPWGASLGFEPQACVTYGQLPVMPTFKGQLRSDQVEAIVRLYRAMR